MRIAAFSFVRNGFDYGVPFIESIQSVLPICDEFVIAVGDSTDGTREAILAIGSDISKKIFSFKNHLLYYFEKWTGIQPFDSRNHNIIRS